MHLPNPGSMLPARTRAAIAWFWTWYWLTFFALLPWMLLRQVVISVGALALAMRTRGRQWTLADGELSIGFVGSAELLVTAGIFSERFTVLRWRDVVIDPGPVSARKQVMAMLDGKRVAAVAVTHLHEEHIGNAPAVAAVHGVPVWASAITISALRQPEALPEGRRLLMGQPQPAQDVELRVVESLLCTPRARLEVIAADGHCAGQVVFYERERAILFAGDAFLDAIYTAPNRDSDARMWIATLDRLSAIPVATLVGAHGTIITRDPTIPLIAGVVTRGDPDRLIARKRAFLCWARDMVALGEQRGLPFSVIEASIFPWSRTWAWRTWFHDESFRLLTCGEFSRTHFVRSLSLQPQRVPPRFPPMHRVGELLSRVAPELLRIHVLALRPGAVLGIAGSIAVSAGVALAVAAVSGAMVQPSGEARDIEQILPSMIIAGEGWALVAIMAAWTWWWAVVGGALTRRMALAVTARLSESWMESLRRCLRPALYLPSALASLCLLIIAVAAQWPWLLLGVPPIWLCAGFLYAAMTLDDAGVRTAMQVLLRRCARPWALLKQQALFLCGFVVSTGTVFACAGIWWWLMWMAVSLVDAQATWVSWPVLALAAPLVVYAMGYTTANLKSLQIWLYARP